MNKFLALIMISTPFLATATWYCPQYAYDPLAVRNGFPEFVGWKAMADESSARAECRTEARESAVPLS